MLNDIKLSRFILSLILTGVLFSCNQGNSTHDQSSTHSYEEIKIIPTPKRILKRGGSINFDTDFRVIADVSDSTSSALATILVTELESIFGTDFLISDLYSTRKYSQSIQLELSNTPGKPESYLIDLTTKQIKITAIDPVGIYYGIQTLVQVLSKKSEHDGILNLPKMVIRDYPDLSTRGIIVSNQYLVEMTTSRTIEKFSKLKLNVVSVSNFKGLDETIFHQNPFIRIVGTEKIPDNVSIITMDEQSKISPDTKQIINDGDLKGLVLDLNKQPTQNLDNIIEQIAEISWNRL